MSDHPSAFDLESYSVGEEVADVRAHLEECTACTDYIAQLHEERSALMNMQSTADFLATPEIKAAFDADAGPTPRAWPRWLAFLPLGLAAATLIVVGLQAEPSPIRGDAITYKGTTGPMELIRLRDGTQSVHRSQVGIKPGDRLRFRVNLSAPMVLSAGVLDPEGTWTPLLESEAMGAGSQVFPEGAIEVTAGSSAGRVILGTPKQVAAARRGYAEHGARTIELTEDTPR